MKYSPNVDYLVASIVYLATQEGWWARTPAKLSEELSLQEAKLITVFDGFPGIFRRSPRPSATGQYFYSLQARYAQRAHYGSIEEKTDIPPLPTEKIRLIYDFVQKSVEEERASNRAQIGYMIAIAAAVISAFAAIYATTHKQDVRPTVLQLGKEVQVLRVIR